MSRRGSPVPSDVQTILSTELGDGQWRLDRCAFLELARSAQQLFEPDGHGLDGVEVWDSHLGVDLLDRDAVCLFHVRRRSKCRFAGGPSKDSLG